jgi:hypothetical protein
MHADGQSPTVFHSIYVSRPALSGTVNGIGERRDAELWE